MNAMTKITLCSLSYPITDLLKTFSWTLWQKSHCVAWAIRSLTCLRLSHERYDKNHTV